MISKELALFYISKFEILVLKRVIIFFFSKLETWIVSYIRISFRWIIYKCDNQWYRKRNLSKRITSILKFISLNFVENCFFPNSFVSA